MTVGGYPIPKLSEVQTNSRAAISDAAYTALLTDRLVAYTALTAARIITLPAATAYPGGTRLLIIDESGNCSTTKTLTAAAAGTDTIDGAISAVVNQAYGFIGLESNGVSHWTIRRRRLHAGARQRCGGRTWRQHPDAGDRADRHPLGRFH